MDAESGGPEEPNAALWLKDAGLGYLISQKGGVRNENNANAEMVMFGSLTRRQSIAVQKRLREVGGPSTSPMEQRSILGKARGNINSQHSPSSGRLVASFSGPLRSPSQKTKGVGSSLLNPTRRSGSYDFGKLSITDSTGIVLTSRRQVDIMETYGNDVPESSCVYKESNEKINVATQPSLVPGVSVYEGFPVYSLSTCDTGVTLANHDLSPSDLVVVRRLAFIESSTVFDELNIRKSSIIQSNSSLVNKLSGKNKLPPSSASTLSSSSLESMVARSKGRQTRLVPILVERLMKELCSERCANTEGLFRVPPSQQRLRELLKSVQSNDFNESQFDFSKEPASDLAALLKHIIRSLSPSLLTPTLEPSFVLAASGIAPSSITNTSNPAPIVTTVPSSSVVRERLRLLNLLVLQLPDIHRNTLQTILAGLRVLAGPTANNRMTASSLAVVLAPLFFPSLAKAEHLDCQCFIVQLLIIYADVLFVVPNQLLDQVRLHNTLLNERNFVSTRKSWWKFWSRERVVARKLLTPTVSNPAVSDQPVLSISAPNIVQLLSPASDNKLSGSGKANSDMGITVQLRLKSGMKVSEAIEITVKNILTVSPAIKPSKITGFRWHLFEIGGNIQERCLDRKANLSSIYKRNTGASWELRVLHTVRSLLPDLTTKASGGHPN